MSLQIWLPLTDDFTNYGLSKFTITNNNTVTATGGKLYTCKQLNGTNAWINLNAYAPALSGVSTFSMAFWCCSTSATLAPIIQMKAGSTVAFQFSSDTAFNYRDSAHGSLTSVSYTPPTAGIWTHYAVTYNKGTWSIYKNGIKDGNGLSYNGTASFYSNLTIFYIGRRNTTSGDTYYDGKINDFRLYDHVLSETEIANLAQCLWVHYPLINRNGILLPSEYKQLEYLEGTGTQYINTGLVPQTSYEYRFKYAMTATDTYKGPFGCYNTESTNCTRIIQYNGSATTVLVFFNCKAGGGGQSRELTAAISDVVEGWLSQYGYNLTNLTRNTHYSLWNNIDCFPTKGLELSANMFLFGRSGYIGKSKIWYFSTYSNGTCVQKLIPAKRVSDNVLGMYDLVTGDFLTNSGTGTFVAGPEIVTTDVAADASGFQNNGTYVGNFVATPNTKRLSSALKFNGTNTTIKNINFNCENIFTVSIWAYSPSSSTKTWSFLAGCNNNGGDADIQLGMYYQQTSGSVQFSANGQYLIYQSSNALKDGWHLFTETFDGSTLTGYIDGVSVGTTAITNAQLSRHNFLVGAKSSSTNASSIGALFDGWLADCRVYATALSADDVMNLYKQGV